MNCNGGKKGQFTGNNCNQELYVELWVKLWENTKVTKDKYRNMV